MKLRKAVSALLKDFNTHFKLKSEDRLNLKGLDEYFKFITRTYRRPGKDIDNHYSEELFLINLYLMCFSSLVLAAKENTPNGALDANVILREDFSGSDIHLCGFLNNICNTANASVNLIKQGYDTQARVLVRTLDERIYQCMTLFASSEDYEKWDDAEDQDEAKSAHYSLFSRKGRILKRVAELEEKYLGIDAHSSILKAWRKERESYYSMAVHGSSAAVIAGSAAFSLEDDTVFMPNLFGVPSSASGGTLKHIIFQLQSLLLLLPRILEDIHGWKPNIEKELERVFMAMADITTLVAGLWMISSNKEDSE